LETLSKKPLVSASRPLPDRKENTFSDSRAVTPSEDGWRLTPEERKEIEDLRKTYPHLEILSPDEVEELRREALEADRVFTAYFQRKKQGSVSG